MKGLSAISGGGLNAVVVDEAELFAGFGSTSVAVIVAVLLIRAPSASAQLAVVSIVTVAPAPSARAANVTVQFCPAPPHTPPPVEEQLLKSAPGGSISRNVTPVATPGQS